MDTNKVLLIWQEIPDRVRLYEFLVDSPEASICADAHNIYINADEDDTAAKKVSLLLIDHTPIYSSDGSYTRRDPEALPPTDPEAYPDNFVEVELALTNPPKLSGHYKAIYVTGFFL